MEENNKQLKSIWGVWWEPIRKWFYPAWLLYEVSIRFYNYSIAVHQFIMEQQNYLGEIIIQILAVFLSIVTFIICSFYLTIPTCLTLYRFFTKNNFASNTFEQKIKKYF
ncbi:hypothetical protein AWE51_23225 [Aquimarina aggregata]|uniref:Uncharacterized protein n=1 Tax=Aquimarina aggregata TaxID=1642818 RepID=A0A163B5E9_9FLAO|nr:hypothetical protein [Aquimarina aggregata]KZS41070.1 hypothetical protein AWE51_23225 [Aquimarina aggregata]